MGDWVKNKILLIFTILFFSCKTDTQYDIQPSPANFIQSTDWCKDIYQKNEIIKNIPVQPTDFPRSVYINSELSDEDIEVTIKAIANWNTEMGIPIFVPIVSDRPINTNNCGTIYISYNYELKDFILGQTVWNYCVASIKMKPKIFINAITHELGHSLNLNHEKDPFSIMYREVSYDHEQHVSDLSKCLITIAYNQN